VSDSETIAEGRQAWRQIRSRAVSSWNDWLSVGHALLIGRAIVMKQVGSNRPVGGRYVKAMIAWLAAEGFETVSTSERYNAIKCAENEDAIEAWRQTLTGAQMRKYNSPSCVLNYWKKAVRGNKAGKRGPHNGKAGKIIELENEVARLKARIVELEDALRLRDQLAQHAQLGAMFITKDEIHAFAPTA
jgi:hypothetical protein